MRRGIATFEQAHRRQNQRAATHRCDDCRRLSRTAQIGADHTVAHGAQCGNGAAGHDERVGVRHISERPVGDEVYTSIGRHRLNAFAHDHRANLGMRLRQARDDLERPGEVEGGEA